jgi:hypothetical protein
MMYGEGHDFEVKAEAEMSRRVVERDLLTPHFWRELFKSATVAHRQGKTWC